MRNSLLFLSAVCFLLLGGSGAFAQTGNKKLVKCSEKGKIVYRVKCKTRKNKPVAEITKPEIPIPIPIEKYGDPNSKFEIAGDGPGTGKGTGGGMGSGSGNGTGTGSGSGVGTGSGNGSERNLPPARPVSNGGTVGLRIFSKPSLGYTEKARTNQVQGVVRLRVTFLANGTIGEISVVSGLPDGLTQQAMDAAKLMRFNPALKNGKPITVTRLVEYNFTLY